MLADALGEVARGLENIEFACGIPHLLKGGFSEQASTGVDVYSIRQPLGVVAGITPFNFPAMVPMWMFANAIACGNTFVLKPSEKDPSASLFLAELLKQAGLPDGVLQRGAGRQGGRRPHPRAPRHRRGQLRRLDADRPVHLRDRHRATASGCRRSAGPRTTWSCCPTPTSTWPPTPRSAPATARPASGAWRSRSCVAVGDVADPLVDGDQGAPAQAQGRPGHRARQRDGPAHHRRAPRQGRRLPRRRRRRGRHGRRRRRATERPAGDGFFLGVVAARRRARRAWTCYDDEIFGPVLVGRARRHLRRGACALVNDNPYGNGTAIFTRDGGAARQFQFDVQRRHGRRQRARSRCRSRTTASAAGRRRCSATPTCTAPRASTSTPGPRSSRPAGPTRRPRTVDLGFPQDPLSTRRRRAWTSASSCRPTRRRGASSSWPSRPSCYGFSHVWTFDSHLLWQEPFVIYSQILAATRKVIVGPMVTNPATRDWTVTASLFATLNEMFGNRTVCGIGRGDSAVRVTNGTPDDAGHAARGDARDPRAGQRARASSTRAARCASRGAADSRARGLGRRLRPEGARADRRGRRRLHPAAGRPRHRRVDDQGGARRRPSRPGATRRR